MGLGKNVLQLSKLSCPTTKVIDHVAHRVGLFSLEKSERGSYKYLKGRCQEGQALLSNRHNLEHRLHLNMRGKFFTLKVLEHWDNLPRKFMEF